MPFKCYHCLNKYHNGKDCIQHCRSDHPDSELAMFKPHTASGYIATHYGIKPSDILDTDLHFDESTYQITYSTRTGCDTPLGKANKCSVTPNRDDMGGNLPCDTDDMQVLTHNFNK